MKNEQSSLTSSSFFLFRLAVGRLIKPLRFLTKTTRSVFSFLLYCYSSSYFISFRFFLPTYIYTCVCVYCCLFICKIIILFFKFECKSINIKVDLDQDIFFALNSGSIYPTINTFLQG